MLDHRFLKPEALGPTQLLERYHCFLSHAQEDASGTVAAMYFAYKALGLHGWIDMRQQKLTLEGMRQGVRDSEVFLLVLSQHVLGSWFCQQEMQTAIDEGKKIQLLIEEEPRFFPFDIPAWDRTKSPPSDEELQKEIDQINAQIKEQRKLAGEAGDADNEEDETKFQDQMKSLKLKKAKVNGMMGNSGKRMIKAIWGGMTEVPPSICKMIDDNLPDAVTYRRRDLDAASMMKELCQAAQGQKALIDENAHLKQEITLLKAKYEQ